MLEGAVKERLEFVPALHAALRHYACAKYGMCIALLRAGVLHHNLALNVHIHALVPALLALIQDR